MRTPLVLMILDGWGYREETEYNAIRSGNTPCWDEMWESDPHVLIQTSGEAVGLPGGQMGNSEVGHMNIGAGRIVYQDFTRIAEAIRDGSFRENQALCDAIDAASKTGGTVHIMGLLSPGGVHSHEDQFFETVRMAAQRGATTIAVHAFLDGRDTPPRSAKASIERMQELVDGLPGAHIRTLNGRYYAMDRDNRWDRVEKAYRAIALGAADRRAKTALTGLEAAYERGENDEFVAPTLIGEAGRVADGDVILFINFRADRAREISKAFVSESFDDFEREKIALADYVCMTEYMEGLPVSVAFPPNSLTHLLASELADAGLRQLRIAETEKYAHVTFFFNGGEEDPFPGEERILVPSPRVATYDLQPEMSAPEVTEKLVDAIRGKTFDVIICNIANGDMVGHTGIWEAALEAVEAVDHCLSGVREAVDAVGGEMLVTADHGNIELMKDVETGQNHTAHTTFTVPLVFHGRPARFIDTGSLRDIAPTMLALLGLEKPSEMTGKSLLDLDGDTG
ncbi:MAG: 2,3-bisphosphoglycerate-independent phosphoglycerate mutase [Gammaproteobacteria bacterium]|nr:2,3-bisphosphoglycerate-independent phosphoglycerate mutase [Gammaproteobacteria bacterium]MBT8052078.1 2,3-bisphosphoglycerate-independent phosphoglycerate mutase [Gammaproteobacteria bacterium]